MSSKSGLKEQAIALRLQGKSYGQILHELRISSKGTLSVWFKKLSLTPDVIQKLEANKRLAAKRGLLAFNRRRTEEIQRSNLQAQEVGEQDVGTLSKRELLLVGAALYWGEGTKSEFFPRLAFTNCDPVMVRLFMRFIREILNVKDSSVYAGIHLYPNTDENMARRFWASQVGIDEQRFYIVRQISKASKRLRRSNLLPHGTVVIKTSKRELFYRVKGMIKGLAESAKT